MKKVLLSLFLIMPFCLFGQDAKIKIDVDRTVGEIDPKIYGVFMEPIHFNGRRLGLSESADFNTLYGTLYNPSSPLADENGFKKDYIEAMKELKITNMRWPGGNFVMGYNWRDGIGPKDQRPARINLAWGSVDNNHVGTDEWFQLNNAIGSENIVCVNLGLSNIMDAVYWVEYCNYTGGSYYSDLRIKNGHKEPYNVKIWDLGNEVDGSPWELGHKDADDYVKIAREAAKAMQSVDHSIKFVASGSSYYEPTGTWVEWNRKILTGLGDMIEYLSIHRYWEDSPDYYTFMGQSAMDFEEKITVSASEIKTIKAMKGFTNPIYLSVDEWGAIGRNFLSVLSVAQCLNTFIRHADVVKMTNYTMLTSLLNSDMKGGTYKSPLFHAFKMYSTNCHGNSIDTYVECDTFNTDKYKGILYLDVTSTYDKKTNTVFVNVINRHKDKSYSTDIISDTYNFSGNAEVSILNVERVDAPFAMDNQDDYKPVEKTVSVDGNKINYEFPPHSITQVKIRIDK